MQSHLINDYSLAPLTGCWEGKAMRGQAHLLVIQPWGAQAAGTCLALMIRALSRAWQKVWVLASSYDGCGEPPSCLTLWTGAQETQQGYRSLSERGHGSHCPWPNARSVKDLRWAVGGPGSVKMTPFLLGSMDRMVGLFASLKFLVF